MSNFREFGYLYCSFCHVTFSKDLGGGSIGIFCFYAFYCKVDFFAH